MPLNDLRPPKGVKHSKKRIGRGQGSGNGKTAGRGHKGAKSRSGFHFKRGFEGGQMPLHRRVPKRGFHNPFRVEYEVVNLDTLGERFEAGTVVTPELLRERGLVQGPERPAEGARPRRARQGADGARAQVQREGGGEDRGRRRRGGDDRLVSGSPITRFRIAAMDSLKNIFTVSELRNRVLFTLGLLGVYRVGHHIPTPGVNPAALDELARQAQNTMFGLYDMFSGGNLSKVTIFALGIMPYISASIILQLLTVVWPYLEKLSKEGELGRRKITQYTRYGTIVLSIVQSLGIAIFLERGTQIAGGLPLVYHPGLAFRLMTVLTLTTGTTFIMWLGEQITERGIGNGMSLIIYAGIVVGFPRRRDQDVRADADRADRLRDAALPDGRDGRSWSARSSSSSAGTGASPCSTPSASSGGGCTAGRARTFRSR